MIWFFLIVLIFWQPLFWTGRAVYHLIKRDIWDDKGYWMAIQGWFKQLWEFNEEKILGKSQEEKDK